MSNISRIEQLRRDIADTLGTPRPTRSAAVVEAPPKAPVEVSEVLKAPKEDDLSERAVELEEKLNHQITTFSESVSFLGERLRTVGDQFRAIIELNQKQNALLTHVLDHLRPNDVMISQAFNIANVLTNRLYEVPEDVKGNGFTVLPVPIACVIRINEMKGVGIPLAATEDFTMNGHKIERLYITTVAGGVGNIEIIIFGQRRSALIPGTG